MKTIQKNARKKGQKQVQNITIKSIISIQLKSKIMPDSVYKIIELVGSSNESWEKAAQNAIERASKSLRELRVAEVVQMDMHLKDGKVELYRTKLKLSFKYDG